MKKNLLLVASLIIGVSVNAQFDLSNAPVIGDQQTLFLLDSNAVDYAAATGATAVWDYSATTGYSSTTRSGEIKNPSLTANTTNFPNSDKAFDLQGLLMNYYTDDASGRQSQGFYLDDPTAGELVAMFTTDDQKLYQYSMNLSDNFTDTYAGTFALDNATVGTPITGTVAGDVIVSVDGQGELKLAETTYSNVLRYKLVDHFVLSFTVPLLGAMEIKVDRVQYEYYDFTESNLPIFIHSKLNVDPPALLGAPTENTIVLSLEDPDATPVGLTSNKMEETLIYPNPANKELNIQLASSMESANVSINDALGRQVYTSEMNSTVKKIDVSSLNNGVYFVKINDGVSSTTTRVIIK